MLKNKIYISAFLAFIFLKFFGLSCVPRSTESKMVRISYVYLPAVFDYLAQKDPTAKELEKQKEIVQSFINNTKIKLEQGNSGVPDAVLRGDLKKYENEWKALVDREEKLKAAYYKEINAAVSAVARRLNIAFVFNRGEELLYAEKEFDITEKVIHELSNRKNRIAPHSR